VREDLTHTIVHDLRNPLGSIMSSLQLIHTAYVEQDLTVPVMKLVHIAMRSGQKMYRLINSLLDLGRLEAGETDRWFKRRWTRFSRWP
jgi:signal transduction histidine kinase